MLAASVVYGQVHTMDSNVNSIHFLADGRLYAEFAGGCAGLRLPGDLGAAGA